jgi:hypothetical protein
MEQRNRWIVLGVAGALVLALPVAGLADHYFDDVADDNPHATGIEFVADWGITLGCVEDGSRFCPTDDLTRQQMATFLYRTSGYDPEIGPVVNAFNSMLNNGEFTFTGVEDYELEGGEATECVGTNMGEPIEMDAVVIDHQLTAVPAGATSEVNVAVEVDRDDVDGDYDVCFTRVDGQDLDAGWYETSFQAAVYVFLHDDVDFSSAEADQGGVDLETAEAVGRARRDG